MASPVFFLSYARDDNEKDDGEESTLVRSFFERLQGEIRQITGDRPAADGSFIDVKIPFGALWEDHLHAAVCECKVFVPLMSASYFRREWCGREWAVFDKRIAGANAAEKLLPVIWHPSAVLSFAAKYQRTIDDKNRAELREALADYQDKGLKWLVQYRDVDPYRVRYGLVVREIAQQVVAAAGTADLPPFDHDAAKKITAHFAAPVSPRTLTTAEFDDEDDACAYFVPVVGIRGQITREAIRERYADSRWNWQPFVPRCRNKLGITLANVATEADLRPLWLDFKQDLPRFIRAAETRGRMVVVVVDAWSTELQEYLERAQQLDESLFRNCVIVVVWSDDPKSVPELVPLVRERALGRRAADRLLEEVYDQGGFTKRLGELLRILDQRLAPLRTPTRKLPPGDAGGLPTVNATYTDPRGAR
jgi:hypothetical protein